MLRYDCQKKNLEISTTRLQKNECSEGFSLDDSNNRNKDTHIT